MQVNASQNLGALYGTNPLNRQAETGRTAPSQEAPKKEKALTVAISPEAQALQKQAEAKKAEQLQESEKEPVRRQQQLQPLPAQRPEGTAGRQRIDLTV